MFRSPAGDLETTPFDMSQVGVLHAGLKEVTTDVGAFTVTAEGPDQVGVLGVLATALADLGVAIDTIDQQIDDGKFHIRMEAHVATDDSTMDDIQVALRRLGIQTGFDLRAFYPED